MDWEGDIGGVNEPLIEPEGVGMTTRRFGRWVSPGAAVLLYAVVISAALSCLSSGSWGFGGAEELEGRVSEGEEAKIIKSSLQQIRSRLLSQDRRNHGELGKTDRDQLGALVDAAVARQSSRTLIEGAGAGQHDHWSAGGGSDESGRDLLQWVDQAGGSGGSRSGGSEGGPRFWESSERSRAASSAKGCGSSCLETLEDRLGGSRTVGGSHVGATGKENVWGIGVAEDDVVSG